jgi:glycosyltransferase involved in cell wall biosynthesis
MSSITILTQYFYPHLISTSQLITGLVEGLSLRGHHLRVLTAISDDSNTSTRLQNIKIVRFPCPSGDKKSIFLKILSSIIFLFSSLLYVLFFVPRTQPLLILSNPPYIGIIGILFKLTGGEYHYVFQDIFPESAVLSKIIPRESILFKILDQLMYWTCRCSSSTIVLSESMKEQLLDKYPDILRHSQINVIENWAIEDVPSCEKNENSFAIQCGLTKTFTILYSGNIGRLHDIETIVTSFPLLEDEPIKWVFIGNGAKRYLIEEYVHLTANSIQLFPLQPREIVPISLTACDLAIVSLISGAEKIIAPCKIYGMLSAGRAILSISEPGSYIDRLLKKNDCGVNCSPNNPTQFAATIRELMYDPERVHRMGKNARNLYLTSYRIERAIEQYEEVLFKR